MPRYIIPVIASVVLIVAVTVVEGIFSERWHTRPHSQEEQVFAERLKKIPTAFDEWTSVDEPLNPEELIGARAAGSYSRCFTSRIDPTKIVKVLIIVGNPVDITRHTPEKCYIASGFEGETDNEVFNIDYDKTFAECYTNKFRKGELGEAVQHLRIFWTFSGDGEWVAKSKTQLISYPAICKIYAITEVRPNSEGRADESAAVGFLHRFIPSVNAILFPPESKSGTTSDTDTVATGDQKPSATSETPAAGTEKAAVTDVPSQPAATDVAPAK